MHDFPRGIFRGYIWRWVGIFYVSDLHLTHYSNLRPLEYLVTEGNLVQLDSISTESEYLETKFFFSI